MNNPELASIVRPRLINTYQWPMYSGQGASSATGDDYDVWLNEYKPTIDALLGNKVKTPFLVDFFTLLEKNNFGNFARFTSKTGRYFSNPFLSSSLKEAGGAVVTTASDADAVTKFGEYIIDHFTGVAYLRTVQSTAVWATAITNANALSAEGFDDWHIWSRVEAANAVQTANAVSTGNNQPLGWFPFFRTSGTNYWTSTTVFNTVTFAHILNGTFGIPSNSAKSSSLTYFVCRKHF